MSFVDLLRSYNASNDMIEFAQNKTWREFYDTCERGDWLIWLHSKTNNDNAYDARKRSLADDAVCYYRIKNNINDHSVTLAAIVRDRLKFEDFSVGAEE